MLCCPEMNNTTATKWWGIPCIGFHSQPDPSPESSTIPFLGCWLKTPPKHSKKERQKAFRDQMLHLGPGWKLHPCPSSPHRQPERSCRDKDKTDWLQNALPQKSQCTTKERVWKGHFLEFSEHFFSIQSPYIKLSISQLLGSVLNHHAFCPEMNNTTATKWWGIPCIGFHSQPDPFPESSTIPFLGCWLETPPKHPKKERQKPFRDQMLHLGARLLERIHGCPSARQPSGVPLQWLEATFWLQNELPQNPNAICHLSSTFVYFL